MTLPLITLTTDFGLEDGYVGMMKGVIYSLNPAALLVDLTHAVQPQNVLQGAFLLYNAYRHFPPSTIHLAVVDPGVGTERRAICLVVPEIGYFVGPDNGLFSYIIEAEQARGASLRAYELNNSAYHRLEISNTFHGRDIFAPVAAHLSKGEPPENLGTPLDIAQLIKLENLRGQIKEKGKGLTIQGQIIHIDHFGNVITNIPASMLGDLTEEQREKTAFSCGWLTVKGLKETYGQAKKDKLIILVSSGGFIEVARVNGRADAYYGNPTYNMFVKVGDKVTLTVPPS
jgi:S-adenosylmethionine hydrolase